MSILSSIKSAGKKVAVGVYNTVNSVGKALSGGKSNAASASMAFPVLPGTKLSSEQKSIAPTMTVAPNKAIGEPGGAGYAYNGGVISVNNPTSISIAKNAANSYGGQTPVKNYSPYTAPVTVSAGGKSSSGLTGSGAESVLGAFSMSDGQASRTASPVSFSSINSNSLSGSNSVNALPSGLGSSNVGVVNNAGVATMLADTKQLDPATNQFVEKQVDVNKTDAQAEADKTSKSLDELISGLTQKDSVLNSEEVKQQNEIVRQRQQEVNNYVAQLNSIVAKQNQDLLSTRGTLSAEGSTEAVYGGIAATINREAAIRALPVQAQIAAAQGNLELAQDYLGQVKAVKQEQIDNEYNYNMAKFKAVYDVLTTKEKRQLDKIAQTETQAVTKAKDNTERQDFWANKALESGQGSLMGQIHALKAGDPNFDTKLSNLTARLTPKATTSTGKYNATQDKYIDQINTGVANSFNYKAVNAARSYADGVLTSLRQKNGLSDIAAINQFQKVIDEGAVTRDQDVKLVQGAQSLVNTLKTKVKKLEKGDVLSDEQRATMENTVTKLYEAKVNALADDAYVKAQIIKAEQNGIDTNDTILGQLGGFGTQSSGNTNKPSPGAIIESGGKRYRVGADGETLEQI